MSHIIHKKVMLDLELQAAFEMFTVNQNLETWLVKKAKVDPVVGGSYELFWDAENINENSTIGCKVTAIEKNQILSFEWKGPVQFEKFMNQANQLTHVVLSFIPQGKQTIVHLIHSGWQESPEWVEAREWFERVWENALIALENEVTQNK